MILGHLLPSVNAGERGRFARAARVRLAAQASPRLATRRPPREPRAAGPRRAVSHGRAGEPAARSPLRAESAYNPAPGCLDGGTHEANRHSAVARARDKLRLPGAAN